MTLDRLMDGQILPSKKILGASIIRKEKNKYEKKSKSLIFESLEMKET